MARGKGMREKCNGHFPANTIPRAGRGTRRGQGVTHRGGTGTGREGITSGGEGAASGEQREARGTTGEMHQEGKAEQWGKTQS